jgi:hypothetical protein
MRRSNRIIKQGITIMRLSQPDIEILKVINEQLNNIRNNETIRLAAEYSLAFLQNNNEYSDDQEFQKNLHDNIRQPLYSLYSSDEIANLDKATKNVIFNTLMLMVYYWPLNESCCISQEALIGDRKISYLLSGHLADSQALAELWNKDNAFLHPVYNERVSTREVLLNFPGALIDTNKIDPIDQSQLRNNIKQELDLGWSLPFSWFLIAATISTSLIMVGHAALIAAHLPVILPAVIFYGVLGVAVFVGYKASEFVIDCILNFIVNQRVNECVEHNKNLKAELDRLSCNKLEKRNNSYLKLFERTKMLCAQSQNDGSGPAAELSNGSPDNDSLNPSVSASTDWNVIGLHAHRNPVEGIRGQMPEIVDNNSSRLTQ